VLRRLAVFSGGATVAAAEAVCGFEPVSRDAVLDIAGRLSDKSMVVVDRDGSVTRLRLLESVRAYAAMRLDEAGELAFVRGRHLDWALHLVRDIDAAMNGRDEARWQAIEAAEHANLVEALHTAATDPDGAVRVAELAGRLRQSWEAAGRFGEAIEWLERALATHTARDENRMRALIGLGRIADRRSDWRGATAYYEEALEIARAIGALSSELTALCNLAYIRYAAGDYEASRRITAEALAKAEAVGDTHNEARALNMLAIIALATRAFDEADMHLQATLDRSRALDSPAFVAQTLSNLADVAVRRGDYQAALTWQREGLDVARALGDQELIAIGLVNTAECLVAMGDVAAARQVLDEALAVVVPLGNNLVEAAALAFLARVLAREGSPAAEVVDVARRSIEVARGFGAPNVMFDTLATNAETAREIGEAAVADEWVRAASEFASEPADRDRLAALDRRG
jgi:tetratricopeptide (TPR) repeat protein